MLDQIKIASPCSADWEQMEGTDRVRFCAECKKNVFNLSAMTRRDAEALLQETNGDICTRLYRRADGKVLTEDCPVGLRLRIARVQRRVRWAVAGALSLATAWGQEKPSLLSGVVDDSTMAGIPNSEVTAINVKSGQKLTVRTDPTGQFRFEVIEPGSYDVTATMRGFNEFTVRHIVVGEGERKLVIVLQIGNVTMGGPIMAAPPKPWWRRLL